MGIINDNFMFTNETGKKLFFDYAKDLPSIDYHCHLVPEMIASDHKFADTYELFLGGDHYKWRQMRSFGITDKIRHYTGKTKPFFITVGISRNVFFVNTK